MITALIRVSAGVEALATTLSALVPAVADGLIGDAVVLIRAPDESLAAVAEAVGATLVVAPDLAWSEGARQARRDWLLCLEAGDVPVEGWIRTVERFVALSPPDRRFGRLQRRVALRERAVQGIRSLLGSDQARAGDLVHRAVLAGAARHRPVRIGARIERAPLWT